MTTTTVRLGGLALACVLSLGTAEVAAGQALVIPRIAQPITLDGTPTEPAWSSARLLPMTMFEPTYEAPIIRTSTVRIAHDGEFLYASGVFADDGAVTANSLIRDHYAEDDLFNLVIDSFDDDQTALWFLVTPAGARIDGAITDNAEGGSWNHYEVDNVWDAATRVTGGGWSAEVRIPLSSLRFEARGGVVRMGLIAGRLIVRLRERHTFPAIRPGPAAAQFKPSLAAGVVMEGIDSRRPLEIRPYALAGWSRALLPIEQRDAVREFGADAKVALGNHATIDLTVNTDFAQTESDDERVNLDRFDLFYPEKRQFFLERSGIFDVGDDDHRLLYSRRIGLSPAGVPERIYGGARLTGRASAWDYGALSMQTEPAFGQSVNNSALRLRRRVMNPHSYVGGIATVLSGGDSGVVSAAGLDADLNVRGSHFVSITTALSRHGASSIGALLRLAAEQRNRAGFAYRLSARHVDADYEPPLGFIRRTGITTVQARLSHGTFGGTSRLQELIFASDAYLVRRHLDDRLETAMGAVSVSATRRGGGTVSAELRARHEDVLDPFTVGEAVIPPGRYTFAEGAVEIELPAGWARRATLGVSGGRYFDGSRVTASVSPAWNVSPHLEITADLEHNAINFPGRGHRFRGDVARLRLRASRDTRLSLYGLIQYNGAFDRAAGNVRVRYNFREGRDLYIVWNEGWESLDAVTVDGEWNTVKRTVLLKYSHATWW